MKVRQSMQVKLASGTQMSDEVLKERISGRLSNYQLRRKLARQGVKVIAVKSRFTSTS